MTDLRTIDHDHELLALFDPSDVVHVPLPLPGVGRTAARFRCLWAAAQRSPSLGRIMEAHHDAIAILHEAGRADLDAGLYAVWAAGGPDPLRLEQRGDRWHLHGSKHWCSAATLADRALVTAQFVDGTGALVLVDAAHHGVRPSPPNWESPAMTSVDTRLVSFDLDVSADDIIGVDDWYLRRPGFWHGAIGVAACWAGCADGIVSRLVPQWKDDAHARSHLGAIDALRWNLRTVIEAAADEIDRAPIGTEQARHRRALRARHLVDVAVGEVLVRTARALGPGPLAHVADLHRHIAETDLYRRQSHAERDLEVLGLLARSEDVRVG